MNEICIDKKFQSIACVGEVTIVGSADDCELEIRYPKFKIVKDYQGNFSKISAYLVCEIGIASAVELLLDMGVPFQSRLWDMNHDRDVAIAMAQRYVAQVEL